MSSDPSFGFLQGMLGDLLKMVKTDAPIQWEMAVQFAQSIATDATTDTNADPLERIRLEQMLQLAERHVADVTGMIVSPDDKPLTVTTTGRGEWARQSLESWRPVIEKIALALKPADVDNAIGGDTTDVELEDASQGFASMMGQWATAMSPMMLSMQIGSVVGHLARRELSQYELLLPRSNHHEIVITTQNLQEFAENWSLSPDDLALWVLTHDVAISAVLARPHIKERLIDLLVRHAEGFRTDPSALQDQLGEFGGDMSDLSDMSRLLGDPSALQAVAETPELAQVNRELQALSSAIDGYAEWVTFTVAERVIGSPSRIREAMRRHRVEQSEEAKTADVLFGLSTDQQAIDKGEAFIRGVIERNGEHELARLWVIESDLPTPAEVDAPGLWLERVNLPKQDD